MIQLANREPIAHKQPNLQNICTGKIPVSFMTTRDYDTYLLCCLKLIFHDDLFFYQIPENFVVYSSTNPQGQSDGEFFLNYKDIGLPQGKFYICTFKKSVELISLERESDLMYLEQIINKKGFNIRTAVKENNMVGVMISLCSTRFPGKIGPIAGVVSPVSQHLHVCLPNLCMTCRLS